MLNEWTDRLPPAKAAEIWNRAVGDEVARRTALVESDLRQAIERDQAHPMGFYEAMRNFLILRDKLFPDFPADPAWKILLTLARTPEGSPKTSISGIAYGAEVPMTTALRYVAAMELDGIIMRVPHPLDKRQVMIRLTDEGRRRLDVIADKWAVRLLWLAAIPLTLICAFRICLAA